MLKNNGLQNIFIHYWQLFLYSTCIYLIDENCFFFTLDIYCLRYMLAWILVHNLYAVDNLPALGIEKVIKQDFVIANEQISFFQES